MKYLSFLALALLIGCSTPTAPVSVLNEGNSEKVYRDLTEALMGIYPVGKTLFVITYQSPNNPTNLEARIGEHLRLAGYACQDSTEAFPHSRGGESELSLVSLSLSQGHGEEREIVTALLGESRKLILAYGSGRSGRPELTGITQELAENEES